MAELVTIGWDGANRPMYRYREDMDLPDHRRRIVTAEDRPDCQATRQGAAAYYCTEKKGHTGMHRDSGYPVIWID